MSVLVFFLMVSSSPFADIWFAKLNPTYSAFIHDLLGTGYKWESCYLQLMGVEPSMQGNGVGKALLIWGEVLVSVFNVP